MKKINHKHKDQWRYLNKLLHLHKSNNKYYKRVVEKIKPITV